MILLINLNKIYYLLNLTKGLLVFFILISIFYIDKLNYLFLG